MDKEAAAYNRLLIEASKLIAAACKKSGTDPACVVKAGYLDFANKTKSAASAALKKNAKDVLKVLSL